MLISIAFAWGVLGLVGLAGCYWADDPKDLGFELGDFLVIALVAIAFGPLMLYLALIKSEERGG